MTILLQQIPLKYTDQPQQLRTDDLCDDTTSPSNDENDLWYSDEYDVCDDVAKNVIVAIKSGASNAEYRQRRNAWRNSAACSDMYKQHNITYKFLLGMPIDTPLDPHSHNQSAHDTSVEIEANKAVLEEMEEFQDVIILPVRDIYDDFMVKTYQVLQWTLDQRKSIIVLHDDEYCIDLSALREMCQSAKGDGRSKRNLYGGWRINRYLESKREERIENHLPIFEPYFQGHAFVLSRPIVQKLMRTNALLLHGSHLSRSEDLRVGYWVSELQMEQQQLQSSSSPSLNVRYIENGDLRIVAAVNITEEKNIWEIKAEKQRFHRHWYPVYIPPVKENDVPHHTVVQEDRS